MALFNLDYRRKNRDVLYVSITIIAVFLFAISVSILNEFTLDHYTPAAVADVYAQPYVETVKHRNLTIDLGNGLKTNAQLTVPAVGEGPFPGVLFLGLPALDQYFHRHHHTLLWLSIFQKEDLPFLDMTSRVLEP